MKTLLKPVLLDFLVTFQHILVFFLYFSFTNGKINSKLAISGNQDSKRSEKLREDLRKLSKEI